MEIYWAVSSTESILTSLCHADHHWLEFWGVKRHLKIWEKHRITLNRCVDASTNDWIDGSSPQKKGLADRSREKTNSEKPFCPLWSCSAACPSAAPPPPRPRAACEKVQKGPVEPVAHWYAALPSAGPWATRPSDTTWLPTWDRDARMQTFTHTHTYIYIYIYFYSHTHTHIYIYIYIYMYVYMCVYMWKKFVLREEVHQQAACYDHANNFLLKFHKSRAITAYICFCKTDTVRYWSFLLQRRAYYWAVTSSFPCRTFTEPWQDCADNMEHGYYTAFELTFRQKKRTWNKQSCLHTEMHRILGRIHDNR